MNSKHYADSELRKEDESDLTNADPNVLVQDVARDVLRFVEGAALKPEHQVAVLLVASVSILNKIKDSQPKGRRGKLINVMTDEYRRVLQRGLTQG